jgi:signal transduction histidine kinase
MTTERRYWLLQCLGWGAYAIIGMTLTAQAVGRVSLSMTVGYLCFFGYSIGFTDLFRQQIRRHKWLELPMAQKVARLAAGAVLIGALQAALVVLIDVGFNRVPWPYSNIGWLWGSVTNASLLWTFLYAQLTARRRLEERNALQQLALREAELRALESQVNPHFLFNCLNSIRALVTIDPPRAQEMLTRLGNVLRHSLRPDKEHTVPLAREVEAVADYLALEAVRFEERLRVKMSIDRDVEQFPVPPMLLQTLVENAIKHGIAQVTDRGDLTVRAGREKGSVWLVVENTGQLRTSSNGTRLGLENARERLRLIYGDRASLQLSGEGERVRATVMIPA